jgi:hypothetical protein
MQDIYALLREHRAHIAHCAGFAKGVGNSGRETLSYLAGRSKRRCKRS